MVLKNNEVNPETEKAKSHHLHARFGFSKTEKKTIDILRTL